MLPRIALTLFTVMFADLKCWFSQAFSNLLKDRNVVISAIRQVQRNYIDPEVRRIVSASSWLAIWDYLTHFAGSSPLILLYARK